jgi:hypothetical protein
MYKILTFEDKHKKIKECSEAHNFLVDLIVNNLGDLQFEEEDEIFKTEYNDIIENIIFYTVATQYQK